MRSLHDRPGLDVKRRLAVVTVSATDTTFQVRSANLYRTSAYRTVFAVLEPDVFKMVDTIFLVGETSDNLEQIHGISPY